MRFRVLLSVALATTALAWAPTVTAQERTRALSQNAVAQAAEQHPLVVAQFGGEENATRSAYVRNVGSRIASQTNIAGGGSAFRITTLNSPVVNAFAVPGGYLYVTRQLLGLMNDEAELASVLGHEAGHIAARHSRERRNANILSQVLAGLAGVVTGSGQIAQIAAQGAQMWTLSYSRSQELESDELGVRYLAAAGYDPAASPAFLASLGAWSDLESRLQGREGDQRAAPSWARTHPLSAERVSRAAQEAQQTGVAGQGQHNRDQYLAMIDGMIFDDDPAQGVIEGRDFIHPQLRLAFTAPQGFGIQNSTSAVAVIGNGGQAQFSTAAYSGNLDAYIDQVFRSLTGGQGQLGYSRPQRTTINGLNAAYSSARAQTQQGVLDVGVIAYEFDSGHAYHFVTITPAGSGAGPFSGMLESVRRISAQEAAAVRPRILRIVTVGANDTIDSLAGRMAYPTYQRERFLVLNGLADDSGLRPGQKVKLVVYGNRS